MVCRHDPLVTCLYHLIKRNLDPKPRMEQVLPQLAAMVRGQVSQARMDIVAQDGCNRILVDIVVSSPFAGGERFTSMCARRDGYAARRAAAAKKSKYDSPDLLPFSVETGGRLGMDARSLIKKLAEAADDPHAEAAYLHRAISSTLQDGIAKQLCQ